MGSAGLPEGSYLSQESREGLLDTWWSRYCTTCGARRPFPESVCPHDGSALRDLSVSWDSYFEGLQHLGSGFDDTIDAPSLQAEPSREPDSHPLPPVLGGKWKISERKGGGSFGSFYSGQHAILGMPVGIKLLRRRFTTGSTGRKLFHEEAMRVSRLDHPNIVKVFDYGEEDNRPYLIMEYLTGKPLNRFLEEGGLSLEEGVEVIRQAATALMAAHEGAGTGEPLVHLDLKPEHVFLEKIQGRWHVKVIDFGIAEIVSASPPGDAEGEDAGKLPHRVAGTLPYMAPERWRGVADPRCDIYSLGVILYEVVAGTLPFGSRDPESLRRQHECEVPAPPSLRGGRGKRSAALRQLDAVTLRCLEKDPARRPGTAKELAQMLEAWLSRPKLTLGQRLRRVAAVPLALALLVGLVFFWGPWFGLVLPRELSSEPLILGSQQKSPPPIKATVSGGGRYDGAEAVLAIEAAEGSAEIPLGTVAGQEIARSVAWREIQDALGNTPPEGKCEARVVVRNPPWRSLSSEPLRIQVHDHCPAIRLRGNAYETGDTLIARDGNLVLLSDEAMAETLVSIDGKPLTVLAPEEGKAGERSLSIPEESRKLDVSVTDPFGNTAKKEWKIVWEKIPRLVSREDRYTNLPEYPLSFKLDEKPGKIEVQLDDEPALKLDAGSESLTYEVPVMFQGTEPGTETGRKVKIRIWSEFAAAKPTPSAEETIQVRHLERVLAIVPESGDGKMPGERKTPTFSVACGKTNLDEPFEWQFFIHCDPTGKDQLVLEPGTRSGKSKLDLPDWTKDVRGKYRAWVSAKDPYGNKATLINHPFNVGVGAPGLTVLLAGEQGTPESPIHNESCPCNMAVGDKKRPRSELGFGWSLDYDYPAPLLDWTVKIQRPEGPQAIPCEPPVEEGPSGTARLFLDDLLPWLKPGENAIRWTVRDRETGESGESTCTVVYSPAVTVHLSPVTPKGHEATALQVDNTQAAAAELVPFKVMVSGLPAADVDRVLVNGSSSERSADAWICKVPVKLADETPVEASVSFKGNKACEHVASKKHSLPPRGGVAYGFMLPEIQGQIELLYCEEERFWYATPGFWAKTLKTQGGVKSRARWAEAEKAVQTLNEKLQDFLGEGRFRLPRLQELKAIVKGELGGEADYEWLDVDDPEIARSALSGDFAPLGRKDARGGVEVIHKYKVTDDSGTSWEYPFRVVLHDRGSAFEPRMAVTARVLPDPAKTQGTRKR